MYNIKSNEELKEIIKDNEIVLVYFGNDIWSVCVDLLPKVELVLEQYPKIKSAYVDVEKLVRLASEYSFFTVPGILVFIEGKETIRQARLVSIGDLEGQLDRYYQLLFS